MDASMGSDGCFLLLGVICVLGASKVKLKNVNKKEWLKLGGGLIFLEFVKASIADLFTLLISSSLATATTSIVVLTPANFYQFRRPKFNFHSLSFTFETFGKKLAETNIVARTNVKKIKA
jgi:hypothetical protein